MLFYIRKTDLFVETYTNYIITLLLFITNFIIIGRKVERNFYMTSEVHLFHITQTK